MPAKIPSQSVMIDLIGQSLFEVWQSLYSAINEKYEMEQSWNSGGKKWTYEYKYRRGGKWVMFEPTDKLEFDDYMKLLAVKRKPNRK